MARTNHPSGARPAVLLALLPLVIALTAGCESEADRLAAVYEAAATRTPDATADELHALWSDDRKITLSAAMDFAFEAIEVDPADEAAPRFAMGVLISLERGRNELPTGGEYEVFWRRIGRLAFWTASTARDQGHPDLARRAMLGGPPRWQNTGYWRRYPDHDALIAYIMAENGQRREAIRRLQQRVELSGPAEKALRDLQGGG